MFLLFVHLCFLRHMEGQRCISTSKSLHLNTASNNVVVKPSCSAQLGFEQADGPVKL